MRVVLVVGDALRQALSFVHRETGSMAASALHLLGTEIRSKLSALYAG